MKRSKGPSPFQRLKAMLREAKVTSVEVAGGMGHISVRVDAVAIDQHQTAMTLDSNYLKPKAALRMREYAMKRMQRT
jgi:hypothetical protein